MSFGWDVQTSAEVEGRIKELNKHRPDESGEGRAWIWMGSGEGWMSLK
jgi:hypothetical protein